jgi:hypothetical protein
VAGSVTVGRGAVGDATVGWQRHPSDHHVLDAPSGLRPGYDYVLERKLSPIWREVKGSLLAPDVDRFMAAAAGLGFTERVRFGTGSQVQARLLIQTGRRLQDLTLADLAEFTAACHDREKRTGKGHKHYLAAVSNTQRVLFHLGIVDQLPRSGGPVPLAERLADVAPPIRETMIAYLERKRATCQPKTVSAIATRLTHFGVFLADVDPGLRSPRWSAAATSRPTRRRWSMPSTRRTVS